MSQQLQFLKKGMVAIAVGLALTACGGGGGDSGGGGGTSASLLDYNSISWGASQVAGSTYRVYYSLNATPALAIGSSGTAVDNATGFLPATFVSGSTNALDVSDTDPNYAGFRQALLTGQVAVVQVAADGTMSNLSAVPKLSTAGLTPAQLDDLFVNGANGAYNKTMGVSFSGAGVPTFNLWAPTATDVKLHVYADATSATEVAGSPFAMNFDAVSGTWTYTGQATWRNTAYYKYNVTVANGGGMVTDPYSVSLNADADINANDQRSFVADLNDASLKPTGWDAHTIPSNVAAPEDVSVYELHVRDFSANDTTVPAADRGKFKAFTYANTNGMLHLKALQQAGLTVVQWLPVNDIASVKEVGCVTPAIPTAAADSESQQAAVAAVKDTDCFNWGYDPLHYNAPEGSYSSNANDGKTRIKEMREAVQALHNAGLRVTIDVVYNHTPAAGPTDSKSTLDKIVPKYYHRYINGSVANSTCCANTATEHKMMEKLMIDSTKLWASAYKLDGFRFDLMGHIPKAAMVKLKTDTDAAAGRSLYYYGEGWNFGEVADGALFVQATQMNMAGTSIGTFSDRARDAIRGGGPFDNVTQIVSNLGYINGAATNKGTADLVRLGFAGTLQNYSFVQADDSTKTGLQMTYSGQKAGYALDPADMINYVDKHDNETLFDINAYKLPLTTSKADRTRVQNLGNAFPLLAQGVPFFHAGADLLRSKSMDRNSYNSGDWFNRIDWTGSDNYFGMGAPMSADNADKYSAIKTRLATPLIKPDVANITAAKLFFQDMLKVRYSSTLFRMRTAQDVIDRLKMYNLGSTQQDGLVVFRLNGTDYAGANYDKIVVLYNVDASAKTFANADFVSQGYVLHTNQANGSDAVVKTSTYAAATGAFTVPARTVAVFVKP